MCILVADEGNIYELLFPWSDYNVPEKDRQPYARFDWFGLAKDEEWFLPLKTPRKLRKFFGLLPAGQTMRVSVAKKSEIDQDAFLASPPAALFFKGKLYESPFFAEGAELAKWKDEFRNRFKDIPDNATLQVVDAHS
jgi:hypothetical protein